jgi:hypothetical protein
VRVKEVIKYNDQWQILINMLIKTTSNSLHYNPL